MQRIHRLRRATTLFAAIATAGLVGLALSTPAQAAPVKPGGGSAGPVKPSDAQTGAVKQLCSTPKSPKEARCFALARTDTSTGTGIKPNATPAGYGPADLQSAYALPSATGGAGQTVAIVDAFDNPNAEADLAVYRAQFGLPACTTANGCFRKLNQNGQPSPLPAADAGWAGEISLDVQMVSAVCPSCNILLVEASSNSDTDLYTAINKSVELGAKYVSNSWGGPEDATQTAADESTFNHPGIVITASSGDDGYINQFPASSKYVTSVGGTALTRVTGGRGWAETVWSNGFGATGSGCSSFEDKPAFQADAGCPKRAYADVSAVADPATGVSVYNTFQAPGWQVYGGTSASSPIIASVYALAGPAPTGTYPNSFPYQPGASAGLNDVTSGSNGSCGGSYLCTAGPGYDGPTGLGTPNGIRAFAPAAPYGTVAGTVTDAGDGHPLAGASVSAGSATDTTDAAGHYDLGLPVGMYDVTASAYGYASKTNPGVTVTQGATTTSDFALAAVPRATVSGMIRDGSGHGWPLYAAVSVNGVPGGPVYTDPATGRYSVSLPVGQTYTLHVTANYPGYQAVDASVPLSSGDVVKDISVPVDAKACVAPGYAIHNYGLFETFDTPNTPAGWSVVDNTADGGWGFTDIGSRGNLTGGSGGFAMVDSDKLGVGKTQDTELRTPVLDLTDKTAPVIAFNSDYRAFGSSTADVDLSLDSGATWATVLHHDVSARGPILEEIAIPQAAGKAGVQVRFHYKGAFAYWWEVDNVLVGQRACEPLHGGLVIGNVTDHNTGNGINGATVTSVDHPADTAKTAATPNDPNLGDGFYWMFSTQTGSHPFTASQPPYLAQTNTVNVGTDWATRADFSLEAGQVTVNPTKIEKTVKMGDTATAKVTLRNTGTQPADVQIGEQDGGFKLLLAQGGGAPVQNINGTYTPHRLATGGVTPKVTSPVKPSVAPYAAPWTDIASYPTPIMDNAVDVNDGKLYSVAGTNGTAVIGTGSVFDPASGTWSPIASLKTAREKPAGGFLGGKFYVVGGWASSGAPEPSLEIYDPASNSWSTGANVPTPFAASAAAVLDGKLYVVGGCDSTVCGKTNVYVYTPSSNSWSQAADYPQPIAWEACGGIGGQLYCAGGTTDAADTKAGYSYNPAANAWSPIADLPIDLWAGSYASANGVLLVSGGVTNGQITLTNQGFAYDPTSRAWAAIANSNNTVYRGGGACGFYKVGGSLGNFNAQAKSEVLPGLDQCAGTVDVPWLSESPTSVTIAPGKSATVTVTLDASVSAVNQPGAYAAQLTFKTNTPYQVAPVDVTMHVSPPKTWGKIAGTVTGVKCDGSSVPLAGATVQIDSWAQHFTLRTDASGNYALWLDSRNNPLDVIVAKDGWQPKYKQWKIKAGDTTTANWTLSAVC